MYNLTACPFCGVIPECYDGDYKVQHDPACYMAGNKEVEWLCSRTEVSKWETRAPGTCIFTDDKQNKRKIS